MYEAYYGLNEEPFRLSSDYRFCYGHKSYSRAKAYMQYAFERAEGFVMITGQPGTGKTTLVNELTHSLGSEDPVKVAMLVTTQMDSSDLLKMVAYHFGLSNLGQSKAEILQQLTDMLVKNYNAGGRALLIIDEAQGLTISSLEELRLLTNLQVKNTPLIQIFLLGQEPLKQLIHSPEMEQVHQRLIATCFLKPLELDETKAFIKHRLTVAGWKGRPTISDAIFPVIHKFSQGIPRRINLICSRLFLYGSIEALEVITLADAEVVILELLSEQLLADGITPGEEFNQIDTFEDEVSVSETDHAAEVLNKNKDGHSEINREDASFEEELSLDPILSDEAKDNNASDVLDEIALGTIADEETLSGDSLDDMPVLTDPIDQPATSQKPEFRKATQGDRYEPTIDSKRHPELFTDDIHHSSEYEQKDYSAGLVLLSVVALLLIITMVLFLISPEGFVEQVYRIKTLFDSMLS